MNSEIIKSKKVRNGIYATKENGIININGKLYFFYSMTEAIKKYRQENRINKNN